MKHAAFLALVGMGLLTILLALDFLQTVAGIFAQAVPALTLLRSLIYLFASISVTVFFYFFHRAQSR